jgi:uncharacterized protein YdcH (DUF465 family)
MGDAQLRLEDDVKAVLLRSDEAFRQMVSEHQQLDERIRHLSSLSYLTDEQRYDEAQLKKRKLALKDRIEARVRGERGASPAGTTSQ